MPQFSANLGSLFNDVDFFERFAAAQRAGFKAVEFSRPYGHDKAKLEDAAKKANVAVVMFNMPGGDREKGERGIACQPERKGEFQEGVGKAIEYARALGVKRINCPSGIAPANVGADALRTTFRDNVKFAAAQLAKEGMELMVEPLSPRAVPGIYLSTLPAALAVIDEVGAANVKLQYDIFHMQITCGDLARTIEANLGRIGHMQFADVPDRHEPGTGEINFDFLFKWIDRVGYRGWIGADYTPSRGTNEGLAWLRAYPQQ